MVTTSGSDKGSENSVGRSVNSGERFLNSEAPESTPPPSIRLWRINSRRLIIRDITVDRSSFAEPVRLKRVPPSPLRLDRGVQVPDPQIFNRGNLLTVLQIGDQKVPDFDRKIVTVGGSNIVGSIAPGHGTACGEVVGTLRIGPLGIDQQATRPPVRYIQPQPTYRHTAP